MKVAIIHYWWLSNRGGEAVVSALIDLFPNADLFIQVCDEQLVRRTLGEKFKGKIHTSFVSKLPGAMKYYQKYLPLMPLALEQWDLSEYGLVLSSESGPSKGVITNLDSLHICYCHSPMRYIWDMYHIYLNNSGFLVRLIFPLVAHWLRVWDRSSADRVDFYIANSNYISYRIKKYYLKNSEVIFPPVDTSNFTHNRKRGSFYLMLGQLVKYKRPDLAVDAFNRLGLNLVVIGEGELYNNLKQKSMSNIKLLGRQEFSVVKDHLEQCKALIFPGIEDFGIVPVDAMSSGAPVIAYGKGGVLDTVIDGKTGILFHEQTVDALTKAVLILENSLVSFDSDFIKSHAEKFDKSVFKNKMKASIDRSLIQFSKLKQSINP